MTGRTGEPKEFAPIPGAIVRDTSLSSDAKVLAAYLLRFCTPWERRGLGWREWAWIGDGKLAHDLGWTEETLKAAFDQLQQFGVRRHSSDQGFPGVPGYIKSAIFTGGLLDLHLGTAGRRTKQSHHSEGDKTIEGDERKEKSQVDPIIRTQVDPIIRTAVRLK